MNGFCINQSMQMFFFTIIINSNIYNINILQYYRQQTWTPSCCKLKKPLELHHWSMSWEVKTGNEAEHT